MKIPTYHNNNIALHIAVIRLLLHYFQFCVWTKLYNIFFFLILKKKAVHGLTLEVLLCCGSMQRDSQSQTNWSSLYWKKTSTLLYPYQIKDCIPCLIQQSHTKPAFITRVLTLLKTKICSMLSTFSACSQKIPLPNGWHIYPIIYVNPKTNTQ